MTPANRHDEVQDALREISKATFSTISETLWAMDKKIQANLALVKDTLSRLSPNITADNAELWYSDYMASALNHMEYTWEETYVTLLEAHKALADSKIMKSIVTIERKQAIIRWPENSLDYEHHLSLARQKDLEQFRQRMIIADQEFQCYLGILRNHEQHNYAQRASMAHSVQKASSALHKTVDSWNQVRRKLGLEALSIKAIREDDILQWSYDTSTTAQNKHNYWYYECISLQERSKEERIYLNAEVIILIDYGVQRVNQLKCRYSAGEIETAQLLHQSRRDLKRWYEQLIGMVREQDLHIDHDIIRGMIEAILKPKDLYRV